MNKTALFLRHHAKPQMRDDVHRVWEKHVKPRVEANPAHEAYFFCYDDKHPDAINVFQLYRDAAAAREFMSGSWYAAYLDEVSQFIQSPPEIAPASLVWAKQ